MSKLVSSILVDTVNGIQNDQYMGMLDKDTMVTRDKWKDFGVDIYMFMKEGLQALGFETVLILGYEGTGKSFGIKYLEPGTCMWYNSDRKNPTFKSVTFNDKDFRARDVYGTKVKPTSYMMLPKSYTEILNHVKALKANKFLDPNPVAFITGHIEDYKSSDGDVRQRLKTLGGLATKMNIEGSVENCLYTHLDVQGDKVNFKFDTLNSGFNTARSLEAAFEGRYIDNNYQTILEAIRNY